MTFEVIPTGPGQTRLDSEKDIMDSEPSTFPPLRRNGIYPSAELLRLREHPVTKVNWHGQDMWLVTRHEDVLRVLTDPVFTVSGTLNPNMPKHIAMAATGTFSSAGGAEHARRRRLVSGSFNPRRMRAIRPRIQQKVDELLDAMASQTPPVDLHEHLSFPLPVWVVCELLGVPHTDRDDVSELAASVATAMEGDYENAMKGWVRLHDYMKALLDRKRDEPAEDLLSDLVVTHGAQDTLTDDQIIELVTLIFIAGHITTTVQIEYGLVGLLEAPDQMAALRNDPALIPDAVEELLRLHHTGAREAGVIRFPSVDVEISKVQIAAGEPIIASLHAANLDPDRFSDSQSLDISRKNNAHVSFGYGPHYCLGAALARIELEIVFRNLLERFPNIDLAVPLSELQVRTHVITGGFEKLPVTW